MKKYLSLFDFSFIRWFFVAQLFLIAMLTLCGTLNAQKIGIGTTNPLALLHVADSSVIFTADGFASPAPGNPPVQGFGRRLMWYADKAAFRAGFVINENWDKDSIGNYSFAGGYSPKAKGEYAVSIGLATEANGVSAIAFGNATLASGDYSTAIGMGAKALGDNGTAIGYNTNAIGLYSTAMGANTNAAADYSTAMGLGSSANGLWSTAIGYQTQSNGFVSTSIGYQTIASGGQSTAMGRTTTASGSYSLAAGFNSVSGGQASTALGFQTTASGTGATAFGQFTVASGDYSIAGGKNVSTNNMRGTCFLGDSDPNGRGLRVIGFVDQFAARFNGGYYFITSDLGGTDVGVRVVAGGNSWVAISDARLKEKFLPVNGEAFLQKIKAFKLGTWNYIGQDEKTFRHYGPMAQDFFDAFGRDDIGTIGCDTLINQQDFLGVNLIGIQALEKRTGELKKSLEASIELINELKKQNELLVKRIEVLEEK